MKLVAMYSHIIIITQIYCTATEIGQIVWFRDMSDCQKICPSCIHRKNQYFIKPVVSLYFLNVERFKLTVWFFL